MELMKKGNIHGELYQLGNFSKFKLIEIQQFNMMMVVQLVKIQSIIVGFGYSLELQLQVKMKLMKLEML
jgi:hypothetical protein